MHGQAHPSAHPAKLSCARSARQDRSVLQHNVRLEVVARDGKKPTSSVLCLRRDSVFLCYAATPDGVMRYPLPGPQAAKRPSSKYSYRKDSGPAVRVVLAWDGGTPQGVRFSCPLPLVVWAPGAWFFSCSNRALTRRRYSISHAQAVATFFLYLSLQVVANERTSAASSIIAHRGRLVSRSIRRRGFPRSE